MWCKSIPRRCRRPRVVSCFIAVRRGVELPSSGLYPQVGKPLATKSERVHHRFRNVAANCSRCVKSGRCVWQHARYKFCRGFSSPFKLEMNYPILPKGIARRGEWTTVKGRVPVDGSDAMGVLATARRRSRNKNSRRLYVPPIPTLTAYCGYGGVCVKTARGSSVTSLPFLWRIPFSSPRRLYNELCKMPQTTRLPGAVDVRLPL